MAEVVIKAGRKKSNKDINDIIATCVRSKMHGLPPTQYNLISSHKTLNSRTEEHCITW